MLAGVWYLLQAGERLPLTLPPGLFFPSVEHTALVPVQERLSDAAASGAHLAVNLQPLVQEDTTLVVSSGTGGLGRIVLGALCALPSVCGTS